MPKKKTLLLALAFAAMTLVSGYFFSSTHLGHAIYRSTRWSVIRQLRAYTYNQRVKFKKYDNAVVAYFKQQKQSHPDTIISLCRTFIFNHSIKKLDLEYSDDISNMFIIAERSMYDSSIKMPMKCDARAHLMRNILYNIGIESRLAHGLYINDNDEVVGHTFLEVFNHSKNAWVVQDPYFNLSYINNYTGRPANLLELCMYPLDTFSLSPNSQPDEFLRQMDYFSRIYSVVVYDRRAQGEVNVVLINKEKLGIGSVHEFKENRKYSRLCEYLKKNWNDYLLIDL